MYYEPLNVENWMCELCTFSQIRSHIYIYIYIYIYTYIYIPNKNSLAVKKGARPSKVESMVRNKTDLKIIITWSDDLVVSDAEQLHGLMRKHNNHHELALKPYCGLCNISSD